MTDLLLPVWTPVCGEEDLEVGRGVCALVDGVQVALFRLDGSEVRAVSNHDPFSGANVISRGIVGSRGDVVKVASPVYKQSFDLLTGVCLDDPDVALDTYEARIVDGRVEVRVR